MQCAKDDVQSRHLGTAVSVDSVVTMAWTLLVIAAEADHQPRCRIKREIEFWRNESIETPSDLSEAAGPNMRAFDDNLSLSGLDVRQNIEIRDDVSNSGPAVP